MTEPLISIVIPTRHEAATIGAFLHRVHMTLRELDFETIVVDDSDHDNTPEVLLEIQHEFGDGTMVVLHRPAGSVAERTLGSAVVTGIRRARGTYVCVMDADGQHPPEAVLRMLATAECTGADYVGGSRYLAGGSARGLDGAFRKAISRGLALLARTAFCLTPVRDLTDPLTGFFLFRRSVVDDVELMPIGWKISLEVLIRGHAQHPVEVPYSFARRFDDKSKASVKQGLLVLCHMLVLLLSLSGVRRFALFGLVGLSGMLVNTGSLMALQAAGFAPLGWPLWASTELAILWNYTLNRNITWRDRGYGTWWLYNLAALGSSGIAIAITTALLLGGAAIWLASVCGIVAGMCLNYLVLDNLVFSGLSWLALQPALRILLAGRVPDRARRGS